MGRITDAVKKDMEQIAEAIGATPADLGLLAGNVAQMPVSMQMPPKLAVALFKARAQFSAALMTAANPYHKSKYAPLDEVYKACQGALTKFNIMFMHVPLGKTHIEPDEDGAITMHMAGMQTILLLCEDGAEAVQFVPPPTWVLTDGKSQSIGSALTYLRRYTLAALLGIVNEQDDDGNASTFYEQQRRNSQKGGRKLRLDEEPPRSTGSTGSKTAPVAPDDFSQPYKWKNYTLEVERFYGLDRGWSTMMNKAIDAGKYTDRDSLMEAIAQFLPEE